MSWDFGSMRVFICSYVLYSFGLILRYIFRFLHLGDAKSELIVSPSPTQADGTERNQFNDSEIDGFRKELVDFLFLSEDFHEVNEDRDAETESSVFMEGIPDVHEESEKIEGEKTECSVLQETHSDDIHEDDMKTKRHKESTVSKEIESEIHEEDGSVFMESDSANFVIHEDDKENGGEAGESVSMGIESDDHEDGKKINEDETKSSVFMENDSDFHHVDMKREEDETEEPVSVETDSDVREDREKIEGNETESSVFMENVSVINEDSKKINENEEESSVFKYDESNNLHHDGKRQEGEEEEEKKKGPIFVVTDSLTTTNKCECLSGKDISGFLEEPTTLRFSFREFYMGPDVLAISDNAYDNTDIIADKDFPEFDSEKDPVAQEEEGDESVQEHVSIPSINVPPFHIGSEAFGGTDSSDEDYFLFNENSLTSDSESESSSSSGLIWGNSEKLDDSIAYQFLGGKKDGVGFESEILKLMMRDEGTEDLKGKQSSCDGKITEFGVHGISSENGYIEMEPGMKSLNIKDKKEGSHHEEEACRNGQVKTEEAKWEEELGESESDEDDFEWEHEDLVEQLKMELRNSRQGGLATILEEEEEEEEETQSPKVVEDLKPLKIEEKLEYKDHIDEIEKVYKSYAEKMRKLDVLNYQTLHALGLLQLKDPLKLISIPKSTIQGAKPIISQNLWSRKGSKISSDPLVKFVHELHRDLELVYVGQVCLSWEILCWLYKKAHELQQYDSQGSHRYNLVAGEFQLFQVLVQRFIENEPYQGSTRIHNYVKNRCVIRNLLQVPSIKDDDSKGGEEDAIASGKLTEIIKESMRVFWEFVRADKDYGHVIFKVSKQNGTDLKEPAISALLVDIRTKLQKNERKLKDIVRSGNCIVKKFQKHHEDQLDHEQLVAQVGLRLISRVVHMSKLRKEQVIWCNEKLHRIKFLSRKIVQVEPSFFLFPC